MMSEPITSPEQSAPPPLPEPLGLAGNLRADLELMRKQAEQEIARLNRKIAARELAAERDVASVTERLAMEQDLTTLQRTLGQKEQVLERITEECRRLEDALEDQHLAFDDLKQEFERKERSLKAARDETERLRRLLADVQEHSVDISQSGVVAAPEPMPPIGLPLPPVEPDAPPGPAQHVVTFSAGLMSGAIILGIVGLLTWGGVSLDLGQWWRGLVQRPDAPVGEPPVAAVEPAAEPEVEPADPAQAPNEASGALVGEHSGPPPTERDRLRDGSLGPTLAVLDGGRFQMGQNSMGGGDSGPEHPVQLGPFAIGVYEVTFQQFDRFVRSTGRRFPDDYGWGRGNRPVIGVSWADAVAYADWLSSQSGRRYRLPSEAEWEFAARAGGRSSYWWGFSKEPGRAVCFDCGSQWDKRSTAPVGSFPPSPFGLYDIAGNAMEWVADCYHPGYEGAPADGSAWVDGDCGMRVARDGAFNKPYASMRAHVRVKLVAETRLNNLGFRIAREP